MNKKFLLAVIAATVMGNAWADDGRILTTQTYVDNADALKQDKIPAGTTGQIVLYNGTDANGQTKFTGRQITTTLNNNTNIPTSGAVINYLNNAGYQQDLKLKHALTRAEMNEASLPKMGLGDDDLYLIPDEFENGNEIAIDFIKDAGDNTTLTTDAVVYGLNKLAKAKQDVLPANTAPDGSLVKYGAQQGKVDVAPIADMASISEIMGNGFDFYEAMSMSGQIPTTTTLDYGLHLKQTRLPDALPLNISIYNRNFGMPIMYTSLSGNPDDSSNMSTISTLTGDASQRLLEQIRGNMNAEALEQALRNNPALNIIVELFGSYWQNNSRFLVDNIGLTAAITALGSSIPTLPTGTAGNIVTYNASGKIGGSVATYTGAATYNATNDANKIPTMSGVTAWAQAKKVCVRWLDTPEHPEHNDENCLLWELPD